jgi:acyl-CoA synthetase (AMP-forming)/AMP-acid ligase II
MYGLTETTTRACYVPPERLDQKRGSCGRPLRGLELRITDPDGRVLPPEQVGEVEVRGPNVMLGYFEEPELTRRTIVDGWLKTGDLGRLDSESYLYLEGRTKDIIKCAGERISPAEIEGALLTHPGVADAAVVGIPDPILGEAVKAFVIPRQEAPDPGDLRRHCALNLSHHKIPREFAIVRELPRTPTGKVQRHLLRTGGWK